MVSRGDTAIYGSCLFVCLFISLFVHFFVCSFVFLFNCLPVCLFLRFNKSSVNIGENE